MRTYQDLHQLLLQLDQRGYKAYQAIQGRYEFPDFTLMIDHVQPDPFASPSSCRIKIPQAKAGFPRDWYCTRSREIALRDYLTRQFNQAARSSSRPQGTGNSGLITIAQPGPAILERSSVWVDDEWVEVRFGVGLPAQGRRIAGERAAKMLGDTLPQVIHTLLFRALAATAVQQQVETAEDADWLRNQLTRSGLVAFVPDGAILPRRSGVDELPLAEALPFQSPDSLRVTFTCPNRGLVTGMGIPAGVTLIVGGGYHGKSTLLRAIAGGIYNHPPGDGRELIVSNATAVKIRAEDGRSITGVDLSPFINHLPQGQSTTRFSTANASGSTSQAANIIEALEVGTQLLLIDEDTAATNLMIRDRRMQALIAKANEPITPFVDHVRQLYTDQGISTILVMGGSGDYFEVADRVMAMENFQPQEVTGKAQAIAKQYPTERVQEGSQEFNLPRPRTLSGDPFKMEKPLKPKVRGNTILFGKDKIDLSAIEQLVEAGQLQAIAMALAYLQQHGFRDNPLPEVLAQIIAEMQTKGLDQLSPFPRGDLAQFRSFELAAAVNRLRTLEVN